MLFTSHQEHEKHVLHGQRQQMRVSHVRAEICCWLLSQSLVPLSVSGLKVANTCVFIALMLCYAMNCRRLCCCFCFCFCCCAQLSAAVAAAAVSWRGAHHIVWRYKAQRRVLA
jgi:hypothetical protein